MFTFTTAVYLTFVDFAQVKSCGTARFCHKYAVTILTGLLGECREKNNQYREKVFCRANQANVENLSIVLTNLVFMKIRGMKFTDLIRVFSFSCCNNKIDS